MYDFNFPFKSLIGFAVVGLVAVALATVAGVSYGVWWAFHHLRII